MYGRSDVAKWHLALTTGRNGFVSYRGGIYSRAGSLFGGFSKQTGRAYPPRLIGFQFNINQGLVLEFGNEYMRVISNGAFITEPPISITGITQSSPAVVTITATSGTTAATPINSGVISSYAPLDFITLAGGTFISPAILEVTTTKLISVLLSSAGTGGYAPADTIHLAGGAQISAPIVTVSTTQVLATPTITAAGTGGTPGTAIVTGTTGTGTKFQANVTINGGGAIASVDSLVIGGNYTVNPSSIAAEPVTGGGLSGAQLSVKMGVNSISLTSDGIFSVNAPGGSFTQTSTSGTGIGATFVGGLFGINAVSVSQAGVYTVDPTNPVTQDSTTGTGLGATFTVTWGSASPYADGDWVFLSGISGMTELNGRTLVIESVTATTFSLFDVYGNPVDSTGYSAYTGGGTAARIYTLTTPYAEADLLWLKVVQSADVMSITCWNQISNTEYSPQDLERFSDDNWVIAPPKLGASISPPAVVSGSTSDSGTTDYQYQITAVSRADGSESIASPIIDIPNSVNNAATAGTLTLNWSVVPGADCYNIYKAPPNPVGQVPNGSLFGYAGKSYGNQFTDSNIVEDFTQVPPLHLNPFAPNAIVSVPVTSGGSGYGTSANVIISTITGTGAVLSPVVVNGILVAVIVLDGGQDYSPSDTATVTGSGTGAAVTLKLGPSTGTYPSTVNYYEERRVYASSPNNPDTYWFSQPGSYTNFDARIPTEATDAITGTPWALEVNGIQFMVSMPGGLVVLTGLSAWQLTGVGGSSLNPQPITPANQQAQPQGYNGCSATVAPIRVDYDIIYLQAKGSIFRQFSYNFFSNIYTGTDITEFSSQLFNNFTMVSSTWCEEPFKIMWVIRNDGVMLSLTYVKPQDVIGWTRHDTNGLYMSNCSVTEPPVDALYNAVQRFPGGNNTYMIERTDNRNWNATEECWCVDAGLSLAQPTPNATLRASSATGLGSLTGVTNLVSGQNYSAATTARVVDQNGEGPGTGAVPVLTIVSGAITSVTFSAAGTGYVYPLLVFEDPENTGTGASASPVLNNSATFVASAPVFNSGNVGSVIRLGGGIAEITAYTSTTQVTANIISPIAQLIPNSGGIVLPATSGNWTLTAPTMVIGGLWHLIGATVTGLADGIPITPRVVAPDGTITLDTPATAVIVGLGFQVQFQSNYLDGGSPTMQGQRKKISAVTARVEASAPFLMGSNQPDGATFKPIQNAPKWNNLDQAPTPILPPYGSSVVPLFTGDVRIPVQGGFQKPGQAALQQDLPLPLQLSALIPEDLPGDQPQTQASPRQQKQGRG